MVRGGGEKSIEEGRGKHHHGGLEEPFMELNLVFFILVGFLAQMIDGALGMAYGVISSSLLLSLGISPAAASASVHFAKVFTNAVSGYSHWKFGNVDQTIVLKLVIPGALGGVIGALIVTSIPDAIIRPFVSIYLLVMAVVIFVKVLLRNHQYRQVTTHLFPLGFIGGFFDSIGGGGWGPIVTSTLLARGNFPRKTIGSANLADFGVAVFQSIVFVLTIGFTHWEIVAGLVIGGVIAAPLAAYMIRRIPINFLVNVVGFVIAVLGVRMMVLAFAH